MKTKNKEVLVYADDDIYELPHYAEEFMAFWQDKLDRVPSEFTDSSHIELTARGGYDGEGVLSIRVCYTRPETYDETMDREATEMVCRDRELNRELALLEKLRNKYPNMSGGKWLVGNDG